MNFRILRIFQRRNRTPRPTLDSHLDQTDKRSRIAAFHDVGNELAKERRFEEALFHYMKSLQLIGDSNSVDEKLICDSIGHVIFQDNCTSKGIQVSFNQLAKQGSNLLTSFEVWKRIHSISAIYNISLLFVATNNLRKASDLLQIVLQLSGFWSLDQEYDQALFARTEDLWKYADFVNLVISAHHLLSRIIFDRVQCSEKNSKQELSKLRCATSMKLLLRAIAIGQATIASDSDLAPIFITASHILLYAGYNQEGFRFYKKALLIFEKIEQDCVKKTIEKQSFVQVFGAAVA